MALSQTIVRAAPLLVVALSGVAPRAAAGDIIEVYVNRCAAGCTIVPGFDDALAGRSSLANQIQSIPAFTHGDAVFDATVACLTDVLAPFNLAVVTSPPAVQHHQLIVAGLPTDMGFPNGVAGVAPYEPGVTKRNAIAFTFAGTIGPSPDDLCWTAAQQLGSMYGLDITFHCADIMSYLASCPIADKTFTDFDASCGEFQVRPCNGIPAPPSQNSFALMLTRTDAAGRVLRDGFEGN